METIEGILREMRDASNLAPSAIEDCNTLLTDSYYDDECQGWLSHYADRIEAATAALRDENAKLNAALDPVIGIVMDNEKSEEIIAMAIEEAYRIYNGEKSNGQE